MNLFALWHAAVAHWPLAAAIGAGALLFAFPGVGIPLVRWLFGTVRGRYLLLVLVVAGVLAWQWEARFSAGYSAAVADQERKESRALVHAAIADLDRYMTASAELAAIGERYEKQRSTDGQAAYARALDDVRAGRVQLREPWRDLPATASAGERDGHAERAVEAAATAVRIGAEADAQLEACQAVIAADRRQ